jgi:transposase
LKSDAEYKKFNLFFEDESRFGLFTRNGSSLTAKGVKPRCQFQQVFLNLYLFGAFSPITGEKFLLEMPNCDANNFQIYLDEFSKEFIDTYNIIVLDNGAFHKAKSLKILENIGLIFLPPYSPELNPAEKMWAQYKRAFTNLFCKGLDEVSNFITTYTKKLTNEGIKSTCGFNYIFADDVWTKI